MKKSLSYLIIIGLLIISWQQSASAAGGNQASDSVTVYSSPELSGLSRIWADEYNRNGGKVRISLLPDKSSGNIHLTGKSIGFVTNEYFPAFEEKSLWKITVGRDVIVPVINSANPFLAEIMKKGISTESLAHFLNDSNSRSWGNLLKNDQKAPAHFYYANDDAVARVIKSFTKIENLQMSGEESGNAKDVISSLQKDQYGIAFARMVNVVDLNTQKIADKISLLPIDKNNNGTLDYNENFYEDLNLFSRGVWIGKYPKNLFTNIYSVSAGQPDNEEIMAFLGWVLGEGQQYLYSSGYSDLIVAERQSSLDKLDNPVIKPAKSGPSISPVLATAIILLVIGIIVFLADTLIRLLHAKKVRITENVTGLQHKLNEEDMLVPGGLFFDRTHTWAFMEQNGLVKVGLDDFLQHITGTLTRIKLKNPGEKVKKGDHIMTIMRNGKQLNLYSPVTGTIKEVNRNLDSDASIVNSSPYNLGWVYRIEPDNWIREIQLLFMSDKYAAWLKSEFVRMKDFLAMVLSDKEKYTKVVLQDGGELVDSTLADLGPEIWDDFQTKFIDVSR